MFASGAPHLARSGTALVEPWQSFRWGRLRFSGNVLLLSQVDQMAAESPEGYPP
jgi:hypothetical protein